VDPFIYHVIFTAVRILFPGLNSFYPDQESKISLKNHTFFRYEFHLGQPRLAYCFNLPYELQRSVENTFFAGITPPPKEPSVTTIQALSDPIIDQLQAMFHGKLVRTRCHPDGIS
jgi:hypothetical protein